VKNRVNVLLLVLMERQMTLLALLNPPDPSVTLPKRIVSRMTYLGVVLKRLGKPGRARAENSAMDVPNMLEAFNLGVRIGATLQETWMKS